MSLSFYCDWITISNFCYSLWYLSVMALRSSSLQVSCLFRSDTQAVNLAISAWQQRQSFSRLSLRQLYIRYFQSQRWLDLLLISCYLDWCRLLTQFLRFFSTALYLLSYTQSRCILEVVSLMLAQSSSLWQVLSHSMSLLYISLLFFMSMSFRLSSLSQKYFSFLSQTSMSSLAFFSSQISAFFWATQTELFLLIMVILAFSSYISLSFVLIKSWRFLFSSSLIWFSFSLSLVSLSKISEVICIFSLADFTSSFFSINFSLSLNSSSPILEVSLRISMSKFFRIQCLQWSSSCSRALFLLARWFFQKRSLLRTYTQCSQNYLRARMSASRSQAYFTFRFYSSQRLRISMFLSFSLSSSIIRSYFQESWPCWFLRLWTSPSSLSISWDLALTMLMSFAFSVFRLVTMALVLVSKASISFLLSSLSF